ncbi:MAG: leucyl aminopeptidase family protein [Saprospiraceae bacterium]|nr:leucyl aminopeptidase family protein [Saprospiraceae bacterium]
MKYQVQPQLLQKVALTIIPFRSTSSKEELDRFKSDYQLENDQFDIKQGELVRYHHTEAPSRAILLLPVAEKHGMQAYPLILKELKRFESNLVSKIQVDLRGNRDDLAAGMIRSIELATYQVGLYKTEANPGHPFTKKGACTTLILEAERVNDIKQSVKESLVLAKHQLAIMDLVNGPGNKVTPEYLGDWSEKMSIDTDCRVTVFGKSKIEKTGLHALLAVNRGSEYLPRFIVLDYKPRKRKGIKTLGLVGKGVTFDTGGLSIKGSQNMHYMKSDMGGAAAVLGTIAAVAELKWPVHLIGIVPVTDNCVDATAIKPGDVIDSYSGKTIEVINTDAEGRLILADGLAYLVKNYDVDHIIDLATLTGSCVRTFGDVCAGMFSNDEELAEQLFVSGLTTGEKVWELPIWPDYDDQMKSEIADIKNLSTKPVAGAITAAKFLQSFTFEHPSWAHLDIAGVAFGDTKFSKEKSATGFGVHLLADFIKENLL